ncbi:MAG: polyprenyl synthetase family protein [Patescibacteria group bacterium]
MRMLAFITRHKPVIDRFLATFLQQKKKSLSKVNQWGSDAIDKLIPFVTAGKCVRGSLVLFSYLMFKNKLKSEVIQAAAGIELLHSGLLIHDDIMDRDTKRRGSEAVHYQYQKLATPHFGESMGITIGDLSFFLGFELLHDQVFPLVSRELATVATAQMQDVAQTALPKKLSPNDILSLYRYKTARYSFSLPLTIGAMLAGQPQQVISDLEKLGESLGILYQIRDDQLDQTITVDLSSHLPRLTASCRQTITKLPISRQARQQLLELTRFCVIRKK